MYSILLFLHSTFRWLVLASLLYSLFSFYRGWSNRRPYKPSDDLIRNSTVTISHIQLVLGVCLYFISPVISYFLKNFKNALSIRDIRFFGMEHSLMMLIAVIFITVGSSLGKRKTDNKEKFKTMAIWFTAALIIILSSIPWPFSPFSANRPYFRVW